MDAQDFQREIAAFLGAPVSQAPVFTAAQVPSQGAPILGTLALAGILAGTGYLIYKSL